MGVTKGPSQGVILWVDDEMDALKSQVLFLESKGYTVRGVTNGYDALDLIGQERFDLVLLDESMPGITGLDTLVRIKEIQPYLPVVMVTKNEEENIMEEAIGRQISDYLIKPVNPHQVLSTLKKIMDGRKLMSQQTNQAYQQDFRQLFMALSSDPDHQEWKELYRRLVHWELEMSRHENQEMMEVLTTQKAEANQAFFKFVSRHYASWIQEGEGPLQSHELLQRKVEPHLEKGRPSILVVIDNLRYDQWKVLEPILGSTYRIVEEDIYYSILPTATQYARNALFSGLLPSELARRFPDQWKNDDAEGGKNLFEEAFLLDQLRRRGLEGLKTQYIKVTNNESGKHLEDHIHDALNNDLTVIVYNFVDMLSHARTEMEVLKELAGDEVSYRSLTLSWFEHSPLYRALKKIADRDLQLFVTTDHGTVRVKTPSKCIGDRQTTSNLRYKHGRNLQFEEKHVLAFRDPEKAGLPRPNLSSTYIFAREDLYLVYPNNYNHYVNYYRNTFQHGGISLEEMLVPFVRLETK